MLRPTVYLSRGQRTVLGGVLAAMAACASPYPQRIEQPVVIPNNASIPAAEGADAAAEIGMDRMRLRQAADSVAAAALADCSPAHCESIARGEIAIGMSEAAVMAATKSAPQARIVRRTNGNAVMVPATPSASPSDRMGQLVMVQMERGGASVISRRGPQGIMVVSRPQDATAQAQGRAAAEALVREGDDLVASNDLDGALNRYDRASVLDPQAPDIEYKAARLLDLQLRPQEALMRYQRFLLSLDIERIRAQGEASAKMAEAIAMAQQRIVVLEKQVR
jgi:tetratricopeptide (TPR) repeat protein